MKYFRIRTMCSAAMLLCAATVMQAQTVKALWDSTSYNPGGLVEYTNGNIAGVASSVFFELTPSGKEVNSSTYTGGLSLGNPLLLASDGNFYGAAYPSFGTGGSIVKITPQGQFTTIYTFCSLKNCADGWNVTGQLVEGYNGNLYGTTVEGGTGKYCNLQNLPSGCGTIFEITTSGKLKGLYEFCSLANCADGTGGSPLTLGTDGNFYGMASSNHEVNVTYGSFFRWNPASGLTTLYEFTDPTVGEFPSAVIQASDGNFYGTTVYGGAYSGGTVFKITPSGEETTLHNFCALQNCSDGIYPRAGVIQGTDGNFYGTASGEGGLSLTDGAIFQLTAAGVYTVLHTFCQTTGCADGYYPQQPLIQHTDGSFYGTTSKDGFGCGCGVVYGLTMGLGPFVKTNPGFGKIGQSVNIFGNGLGGATSVTFNGVTSTFRVTSSTLIKAMIPAGATTGTIQVTTPSGTLSSNVAFQILP